MTLATGAVSPLVSSGIWYIKSIDLAFSAYTPSWRSFFYQYREPTWTSFWIRYENSCPCLFGDLICSVCHFSMPLHFSLSVYVFVSVSMWLCFSLSLSLLFLSVYVGRYTFFVDSIMLSTVNQSVSCSWRKMMIGSLIERHVLIPFTSLFLLGEDCIYFFLGLMICYMNTVILSSLHLLIYFTNVFVPILS